jgi:hypothetical protein
MDRRYLESNFRLRDNFSWLHELLCNADGGPTAIDGASVLQRVNQEKWGTTSLDWKNPAT